MSPLLKSLSEEKVVVLNPARAARLPFTLKGIVRLIDARGNTLALVLDRETLEEIEEDVEAADPAFLASLEISRRSGRVSSKEVKRKSGLK